MSCDPPFQQTLVEAAAEQIENELGPIDVWVNVAMTSVFAKVLDIKPEEYRRLMDVIFMGYVHGTQSAALQSTPFRGSTIHCVPS